MCKRDRPDATGLMRVRGLEALVPPPQLAHRMPPGSSSAGISLSFGTPREFEDGGAGQPHPQLTPPSPNKGAFEQGLQGTAPPLESMGDFRHLNLHVFKRRSLEHPRSLTACDPNWPVGPSLCSGFAV